MQKDSTDSNLSSGAIWAAFDDAFDPDGFGIDGYEILGELDRGGMGVVYHARQKVPEREVALKVMLPKYAGDTEMRERFQTEARAMATLDHPGILPVYEVGEADGMPYFSMKLALGGSLASRLKKNRVSIKDAVSWMIDISAAVHFAHQRGVLHRDLKPGNFLFDDKGAIYVGDFGVAKMLMVDSDLTDTQSFIGTPNYMPPELVDGSAIAATTAGDQYSLGAVFYECLIGKRPYAEYSNIASLIQAIASDEIRSLRSSHPKIPLDLDVICSRALARSPGRRYSSVDAFRQDLIRWQTGRPILARPVSLLEKATSWARRHPLPFGLLLALIVISGAAAIVLSRSFYEQNTLRDLRLHEALMSEARSSRLLARPGFRERVFEFLNQANELKASERSRVEAAAALVKMDLTVKPEKSVIHTPPLLSPNGKFELRKSDGDLLLVKAGSMQHLRRWKAVDRDGVLGAFLPCGDVVVARSEDQAGVWSADGKSDFTPLNTQKILSYLSISPAADVVALGGEELELIDAQTGQRIWTLLGNVRCQPVWSENGRLIAVAIGKEKKISIYDFYTKSLVAEKRMSGWPQSMAFRDAGDLIAVSCDDGTLSVLRLPDLTEVATVKTGPDSGTVSFEEGGRYLRSGRQSWEIQEAIGYREWRRSGIDGSREITEGDEGTVLGMRLSPDGRFILTMTTAEIEIYDTAKGRRSDFHNVNNQRIDVRVDGWWSPENQRRILLQIPGGLESMEISDEGKILHWKREEKVPGATILDIKSNGDYIVEVLNDEDEKTLELWKQGDDAEFKELSEQARPTQNLLVTHSADETVVASVKQNGTIEVSGAHSLVLTLPESMLLQQILISPDGHVIYGLSRSNRLFEWNLNELENELKRRGF